MKTLRSSYARHVLVPVMAVSVLSACYTWTQEEMAPIQVVTEKEPSRVRLTMLDSTRIELADPRVSGDEIWGNWNWERTYGADLGRTRAPIDSVSYVEIRKTAIVETVLLGILAATVVAAAIFVAAINAALGGS
jgi:hypothetical protein